MIWALAPKQKHASLFAVQAAVAEAVMKFNAGYEKASTAILDAYVCSWLYATVMAVAVFVVKS